MSERNGFYERIDGSKYRNIFVVGDLHGCYNRLMTQLIEVGFDQYQDLLISVGDLIDRGVQNIECLELMREPWFKAVKGNHEQMAIAYIAGKTDGGLWFHNGGNWYWQLDPDQQILASGMIRFASTLPLVIEVDIEGKKTVIAHADYPANEYEFGKLVDPDSLVWNRDRFNDIVDGNGGDISGADQFFFGHTPTRTPAKAWNQNYIDTGAVFGHLLTIVQIKGEGDEATKKP